MHPLPGKLRTAVHALPALHPPCVRAECGQPGLHPAVPAHRARLLAGPHSNSLSQPTQACLVAVNV